MQLMAGGWIPKVYCKMLIFFLNLQQECPGLRTYLYSPTQLLHTTYICLLEKVALYDSYECIMEIAKSLHSEVTCP